MITYEDKIKASEEAVKACITAKELQEIQIKKGYKTMFKGEFNTKVLVAPKNFEQRLKEGYKFLQMKVELLPESEYSGSDKLVCDVARVSYGKEASNYTDEQNAKLIKYLVKHGHLEKEEEIVEEETLTENKEKNNKKNNEKEKN